MGDVLMAPAKDKRSDYFMSREEARKENPLHRVSSYKERHEIQSSQSGEGRDWRIVPDWCRKGKAIIGDREDGFMNHPAFERRSG